MLKKKTLPLTTHFDISLEDHPPSSDRPNSQEPISNSAEELGQAFQYRYSYYWGQGQRQLMGLVYTLGHTAVSFWQIETGFHARDQGCCKYFPETNTPQGW